MFSNAALQKTQGHTRLKPALYVQMRHRIARVNVGIMNSICVSMTRESTPDTPENNVLCSLFSPITRQLVSGRKTIYKKRKTLPKDSACIAEFTYVTMQYPRSG